MTLKGEIMDDEEWLDSLKAGSMVIIKGRYGESYVKIDRMTKTQFVIGSTRYARRYGGEITSDRWSRTYMVKPTEERVNNLRERIRRKRAISVIKNVDWDDYSIDVICAIVELLAKE